MGIHKRKTLEELRVQAINSDSDYLWKRYFVAAQGKKRNKEKKIEFEEYLKKEMKTYGHLE